jgi:hypothetical protein
MRTKARCSTKAKIFARICAFIGNEDIQTVRLS